LDREKALSKNSHQEDVLPKNGHGPDSLPEKPPPCWFAVYTSPRHEKRVSEYLKMREIEHYLPIYQVRRKWRNGLTVTLDLPLFPGYLFVYIERSERVRVLEAPGVLSFVGGTGGKPAPLPETEIDALRAGLPLRHAEPHPLLIVGQRARICSGPLSGMDGVVVRKKNSLRVVLTVDMIMQSVSVEVDASELECLDPAQPRPEPSLRVGAPSFTFKKERILSPAQSTRI
jgi:transcription antitermination factor NusG